MLVILKLIEARARRRQQDNVSSPRYPRRDFNSAVESPRMLYLHTSINLAGGFVGGCANQQRQDCPFPQWGLQRRVVASLILAAENHQNATRKRVQGLQ